MSGLGKIFVVLNLVLSLVIVGAAAAYLSSADDMKTKYDEASAQLKTALEGESKAKSDLNTQRGTWDSQLAEKQNRISELELRANELNDQLKSEQVDGQQLRDDVTRINTVLQQFQTNINDLQNRNNELTDLNAQLRTDALDARDLQRQAEDELQRVQDELDRANAEIEQLQGDLTTMGEEKSKVDSILSVAKRQGFDTEGIEAVPEIPAKVQDVNNELGFVILDVGQNANVKMGYTFHVYRNKQYLGEVQVDDVYADYCAAHIKSRVDGAQIMVNDVATTLL